MADLLTVEEMIARCGLPAAENTCRAVFLNGKLVRHNAGAAGMIAGSFDELRQQGERYGRMAAEMFSGTTLPEGDGFFVFIPAHAQSGKPFQLMHLLDGRPAAQVRQLILAEAGSAAEILICNHTVGEVPVAYHIVTEALLGEKASLNLTYMQQINRTSEVRTHVRARQMAHSRMNTHYILLNGASVHNSLHATLEGAGAEHIARGLSFTCETEHIANETLVEHAAPGCRSHQLFKHILSGASTGVFSGKITVSREAQQTAAYQRSSNILMDPAARMHIRPHLEIYADEVKCSHGATVGQLDAEALFYLRSRGVGEREARKILLQAFAEETLDGIGCQQIKKEVERQIKQKMEN
ncbi:MAG: Fe-S cluster assembly protein SufD [Bacteroidales bacterium]|jgi:Fe-S cluster assembly protein SufD|nr:Fe-S cluster assembly protein SufD [Bacteroidales bacterium]